MCFPSWLKFKPSKMKHYLKPLFPTFLLLFFASCDYLDDYYGGGDGDDSDDDDAVTEVDFSYSSTLQVGGDESAEISAFDPKTNKLFIVNVADSEISVFDISDLDSPIRLMSIPVSAGAPNSVAVNKGRLAVAIEADNKQADGRIEVYDTDDQMLEDTFQVGALPDMVTFSPDGKYLVAACEGEPNDDYTVDPKGAVAIIKLPSKQVRILEFDKFNADEEALEQAGFRVFGPNANLAMDVEPEYVAISDDSKYAWVTLQENNGVARVNLRNRRIEAILPLGYKDYSLPGNEIDPSDEDGKQELRSVPAFGTYHPDAIAYYKVNGTDYIVTANEGDAREYEGNPGFVEEDRIKDVVLDPMVFPDFATLQEDENLGRLKLTLVQGDTDGDGDYDELYTFGARSFSIWTGTGELVYDSGNDIASRTLDLTPAAFNGGDGRSDDKGAEPETVTIHEIAGKQILFVGLERNNQVMVYDISSPSAPEFLEILERDGDVGPEGLIVIDADDSPTGKDILVVANEVSGTISFYEN